MKNSKKNLYRLGNEGVAMVSVMIIATVCFLVATIVLEITYTSLLSRKVYRTSADTMYSAETAVDDMETVLQSIAVYSIKQNKANPNLGFVDVVESTLINASGAASLDDSENIADYIYDNLDPYYKKMFSQEGTWNEDTKTGVRDGNKFKVLVVKKQDGVASDGKGSLAVKVQFSYEDETGYLSDIETDLVINDVTQRKSASDFSLGSYSMFTGGGFTMTTNNNDYMDDNKMSVFRQEGNAYVGTMSEGAPMALDVQDGILEFAGDFVEINGDLKIEKYGAVWFSSDAAQINVKGTIYIDKNACLVVNEGVDLLCQDIVIVDGANQWSVFGSGAKSYANYKEGATYAAYFPFTTNNVSEVEHGNGQVSPDYKDGSTGGCVLLRKNNNTYVLEYDGTKWNTKGSSVNIGSTKISYDKLYMAEAKTTVWTYNDMELTTDPELARIINIPNMYLQYKIHTGALERNNTGGYIIKKGDADRSIVKQDFDNGGPGADCVNMSSVNGMTTSQILAAGEFTRFNGGYTPEGGKSFMLNGIPYNQFNVFIGEATSTGGIIHGDDFSNSVLIACMWDAYKVQAVGGQFIGICISGELCTYEIHGKSFVCNYSILNAKDDMTDPDAAKLTDILDEMQYVTYMKGANESNKTQHNYLGPADVCYDHAYQYCMLDNLFMNGIKSLSAESAGSVGGSVEVSDNSMYDFISVENWSQY